MTSANLVIRVGDLDVDPFNGDAVRVAAETVAKRQLAGVPDEQLRDLLEAASTLAFEHFIALGNAIYARSQIGILDDQLESLQQALGRAFGFISSQEPSTDGGQLDQGPQIYIPER